MSSAEESYSRLAALISRSLFAEAASIAKDLVARRPAVPEYWHMYSIVAVGLRKPSQAIQFSKRAIDLSRGVEQGRYRAQLANAFMHGLDFDSALAEAEACVLDFPEHPGVIGAAGLVFSGCGKLEEARDLFHRAAEGDSQNLDFQFNLATVLRGLGDLDGAEQVYAEVIEKNPLDVEAHVNRSYLRKQTVENNHIDLLLRLSDTIGSKWRDEVQVCYALAKEYEDISEHVRSFEALKRGADLRRSNMRYDVEQDVRAISQIKDSFTREFLEAKGPGCTSEKPIFVVGLPRTGTTLVERILSSHSQVASGGELQNFASVMMRQIQESQGKPVTGKSSSIEASLDIDYRKLGQEYLEEVRPLVGDEPRFVDKLPLNYLYLGLIALSLPNAKIVHLQREPMDACYAIYKTLFQNAYPFSYSLRDLGRYYLAYHELMDHWREVLPGKLLDVSYEKLVEDQEGESRRLVEFCDLEWEEGCLDFHLNTRPSMTASASQIRQPIYSGSVGLWRRYEEQLSELTDVFRAAGICDE